jgi:uncharacterized protein (TIGR03086 family)
VVDHINLGNRMAELLLHGADAATSIGPAAQPPSGEARATTYAVTSAAQLDAFSEADALARTVRHPAMDMVGEQLLMFRTLDLALHGWDLATGIGADPSLDPDVAESLWTRLEPFAPLLAASGMFGTPKRDLPADATAADKLLTAAGR